MHVDGVDLNLLVALGHLFEARSVTTAANRMRLTQPAMSRVLGRLRKTFSDPLFLRTPRGLVATPRAELLKPLLDEALARVDAVIAGPVGFDPTTTHREFTIASADYAQAVVVPALLERLRREAPGVSTHFVTKGGDWEAALLRGDWDVVWAPRGKDRSSRAIVWNRLLDEQFSFVVRRGHPASRRPFTLERFLALEHVALSPEGRPGNRVDETLARLGHTRRVVLTVPSFLVVPHVIATSDLGGVLPRRIVAQVADRYGLTTLPIPFALGGFDISQAFHERARNDPAHAWFRHLVRRVTAELPSPS